MPAVVRRAALAALAVLLLAAGPASAQTSTPADDTEQPDDDTEQPDDDTEQPDDDAACEGLFAVVAGYFAGEVHAWDAAAAAAAIADCMDPDVGLAGATDSRVPREPAACTGPGWRWNLNRSLCEDVGILVDGKWKYHTKAGSNFVSCDSNDAYVHEYWGVRPTGKTFIDGSPICHTEVSWQSHKAYVLWRQNGGTGVPPPGRNAEPEADDPGGVVSYNDPCDQPWEVPGSFNGRYCRTRDGIDPARS